MQLAMSRVRTKIGSHNLPYAASFIVSAFILIAVVAPLAIIFAQTFVDDSGSLSLATYRDTFGTSRIARAVLNTTIVVLGSTVMAVLLGTGLAWVLARTDVPFRRVLNLLPVMPMFMPPIVGAVAWVFLLGENAGLVNIALRAVIPGYAASSGPLNIFSLTGIIWVIGIYTTPYVYLIILAAFRQYDASLEEAARVAGSKTLAILRRITLPVLTPAIVAGALLAFVMAMAQFAIPVILGRPANIEVLTTVIYGNLRRFPRDINSAAALCALTVVVTAGALYVQRRMTRGSERFVTVTGKGARKKRTPLGRWRWPVFGAMVTYVVVAVVGPLIALVNVSLRPFWSTDLSLETVTFASFQQIAARSIVWESLGNSLWLAFCGATIGMLLATMTTYTIMRTKIRARNIIDYAAMLPVAVPATVLGAALLLFFLEPPLALYGTNALLIIAYVANFLPHGTRSSNAAFGQVGSELEEAALACGSSWLTALRRITLPLVGPGIAAGWVFLFVLMSREVSASALLAGPQTPVMAITLLDLWLGGRMPQLAAFSLLVLAVSAVMTIAALWVGEKVGTKA